jgi:hypothetical protein
MYKYQSTVKKKALNLEGTTLFLLTHICDQPIVFLLIKPAINNSSTLIQLQEQPKC